MISPERAAEILRLYHAEKWRVGTLARQLGVHHNTVRRVLAQAGQAPGLAAVRPSMVDVFVPLIRATFEKYPTLRASRLYAMVRERGYTGGPDHFRHVVARYRPAPVAEAYLRLRTLPGEQAQVDWGYFGKLQVGRAERALWGFVMVLSYSRQIFLRFFFGNAMANFLRGHVTAFESWAGVPRVLLYDNLKSAVLERVGQAIHFNPTLLDLAAHYRFEPRPVAVARGNEKGRVERAIRYIRDSFFAARRFADLADLNAQATAWCAGTAADRACPEDRTRRVREVFVEEQARLLALPENPFPCEDREETTVRRWPYVRFDLNDYSVPYTAVRRAVVVYATLDDVRIVDGTTVIASHVRSYDKGEQIEKPEHVAELVAFKRAARHHRGLDRLHHACANTAAFFAAVAARQGNLGATTTGLITLLDLYGASALDAALGTALHAQAAHLAAVRQILEQRRHAATQPPPIPVALSEPQLRDLVVHPHELGTYDQIHTEHADDDTDNS
ncbi:MAG: IS21 family transposase [Acidobacteria bacterium]|nr:IS21 family transposase [Acidobacteriota bacterium]